MQGGKDLGQECGSYYLRHIEPTESLPAAGHISHLGFKWKELGNIVCGNSFGIRDVMWRET